jgi:LacI family transcriptional regulator
MNNGSKGVIMARTYSIVKIADELNLSRNTVSKVINGKPGVSLKTRRLVENFFKIEPGMIGGDVENQVKAKTILFSYKLENVEYINGLLNGIEKSLKENGYLLALNIIENTQGQIHLPPAIQSGSICGIISFNIYDPEYWHRTIDLKIPCVFFDSLPQRCLFAGETDIIIPENEVAVMELVKMLKDSGRRNLGYYGNPNYCLSLRERWLFFRKALAKYGLPLKEENYILDNFEKLTDLENKQIIKNRLMDMRKLPDAYVCASDRQAILLMGALKELSISIPDEIAVTGFDNLPETLRQIPPLTTVEAYSKYQGELAVKKILERLVNPSKPYEFIHTECSLILRESTGHKS